MTKTQRLENQIETLHQLRKFDEEKIKKLEDRIKYLDNQILEGRIGRFNNWVESIAHLNESIAKVVGEGWIK